MRIICPRCKANYEVAARGKYVCTKCGATIDLGGLPKGCIIAMVVTFAVVLLHVLVIGGIICSIKSETKRIGDRFEAAGELIEEAGN